MDILSPKEAIKLLKGYGAKMESDKWSVSFDFSKGQALLRQFNKTNWALKIVFYIHKNYNYVEIYYENGHIPTTFHLDSTEIQWEQAFKRMIFNDPQKYKVIIEFR